MKNFLLFFSLAMLVENGLAQEHNINDFGAIADGKTINTKAIQSAIDKCSADGGKLIVPPGTYITGTLYLKNNVIIQVNEGAVLKGSGSFTDYPVSNIQYKNTFSHSSTGSVTASRALIFAEGIRNISITGKGTINGSGDSKEFDLGDDSRSPQSRQRPCLLLIINCKKVTVEDLTLMNSAYWMENYIGCDGVHLNKLKIFNHTNYNQDAVDIDSKNVLIENCEIDVDDDGICLKSHERMNIVENVVVRNCKISTNCNAIKFGTASIGGFKNINITNCQISKASQDNIRHWQTQLKFIDQPVTVISGIAIESVDGAIIEKINISNIKMQDVQTPIFIVLGNRARKPVGDTTSRPGQIRNVVIKDITAIAHSKMSSSITAFPASYVENVVLENIMIQDMGGGTAGEALIVVPENPRAYPENRMYGQVYSSSGLFVRHVKNLDLKNIQLSVRSQDARPAIVFDDVIKATISRAQIDVPSGNSAAMKFTRSSGITISAPIYKTRNSPLVEIADGTEKEVILKNFPRYDGWLRVKNSLQN